MERIQTTKRNKEIDYIKGFLLVMVMLGHTTASFGYYSKTPLLEYISSLTVSFIMPLFLVTTGYFIYSDHIGFFEYVVKKFKRLIVPALFYGAISGVGKCTYMVVKGCNIIETIPAFLESVKYLWYLYSAFISAIIIGFIRKTIPSRRQTFCLVLIGLLLHFVPTDRWNIAFSYSFILVGHLLRMKDVRLEWISNHKTICAIITLTYMLLLNHFQYSYSIYVAGTNLITNNPLKYQLGVDFFRYVMGLIGCISITWILDGIWNTKSIVWSGVKDLFQAIGIQSLRVYCLQYIIIEVLFHKTVAYNGFNHFLTSNPYICFFVWRHIFGIVLIFLTFSVAGFIERMNISVFSKWKSR